MSSLHAEGFVVVLALLVSGAVVGLLAVRVWGGKTAWRSRAAVAVLAGAALLGLTWRTGYHDGDESMVWAQPAATSSTVALVKEIDPDLLDELPLLIRNKLKNNEPLTDVDQWRMQFWLTDQVHKLSEQITARLDEIDRKIADRPLEGSLPGGSGRFRRTTREVPQIEYAYYFDLSSGRLQVDKASLLPPINDGKAVKAVVFSCGECTESSTRFIAWLEKYTDEAKKAFSAPTTEIAPGGPEMMTIIEVGHLIASVPEAGAEPKWVQMNTREGTQVMQAIRGRCEKTGGQPTVCGPQQPKAP